jgi:hypothetical protein
MFGKNRGFASIGSADAVVGRSGFVPRRSARSNSDRTHRRRAAATSFGERPVAPARRLFFGGRHCVAVGLEHLILHESDNRLPVGRDTAGLTSG